MRAILEEIRRVAPYPVPVLLTGESGAGKEVIARLIHAWSGRQSAPFIPVNAAALRGDLLESSLFGHVRGAFTGAVRSAPGLAVSAGEGTLFLDEIGEADPGSQSRLLRFLESGEYIPLGCSTPARSKARVITATNRDLPSAMEDGSFRKDLYYRLSMVSFEIPPLRDRVQDIIPLAEFFIDEAKHKFGLGTVSLSRTAHQALVSYSWPGNVRELRNEITSAVLRKAGGRIEPADLSPDLLESATGNDASGSRKGLDARLDRYERTEIFGALRMSGSNCSRAAEILGLKRTTLLYRMRRHGIVLKEEENSG